jgi:two-component system, OmpR family, sensor kinase
LNRYSLFSRLTLFLLLILVAVAAGGWFLHQEILLQHRVAQEKESDTILGMLRRSIHLPEAQRIAFFKVRGYTYEHADPEVSEALDAVFETPPDRFPIEIQDSIKKGRIQIKSNFNALYVIINRPEDPFMIRAELPENHYTFWFWSGMGGLVLLILGFYLSVLRSLMPLRHLAGAIRIYGEEGRYVPTRSNGRDEIAYVANAFDAAVRKNRTLTEARRLFMRNVMHELKTPLTVGKLALPFLEASKERDLLDRSFLRMEHLIDEMARIEQITSGAATLHLERCALGALIDTASEQMISMESGKILRRFDSENLIRVDCAMMTTVFKNLIDNAFKYSDDHQVVIKRQGDTLLFVNRGTPWPEGQQFEILVEPFVHARHSAETNKSFGLGLYIVKSILEAQQMRFSHYYENGQHHFVIERVPFLDD